MLRQKFLNRILVCADRSASSLTAEETTVLIAKKTRAVVTVLHVMPELRLGYRVPEKLHDELLGSIEQHAKVVLDGARALFIEEKVKVDTELLSGDPADVLLEFAKKDYDLIVMGSRGENEKDTYALGSVTKKVMMHTNHPTLIVKKITPMSNLLVCVDGSKNSIKALDYSARLAEVMGSKITLLNVQEKRLFDSSPETIEKLGEKILLDAEKTIRGKKMKVDKRLEIGVSSDVIVQFAEKGNYDLIVLGRRGLGNIKRFLLGSISDDVSHKAKCSVLIVPTKI